jgi:hypothetical protein
MSDSPTTSDPDARRRELQALINIAVSASAPGTFIEDMRRIKDQSRLIDLLSEMRGSSAAEARRDAVVALLQENLTNRLITRMTKLSNVGTAVAIVGAVLAAVQAAAAVIALLTRHS